MCAYYGYTWNGVAFYSLQWMFLLIDGDYSAYEIFVRSITGIHFIHNGVVIYFVLIVRIAKLLRLNCRY